METRPPIGSLVLITDPYIPGYNTIMPVLRYNTAWDDLIVVEEEWGHIRANQFVVIDLETYVNEAIKMSLL